MSKFTFDSDLCMGCFACETACKQWHSKDACERGNRMVGIAEEGQFPYPKSYFTSRPMFGCDLCQPYGGTPHCVLTCPTGALGFE